MNATDLHTHTTASDGELAPETLVRFAYRMGITTLAITDHDTTEGIAQAQHAAQHYAVQVIPGIEISTETEEDGDVHLLGYFIRHDDVALLKTLSGFRQGRYQRARAVVEKLDALGVPVGWERVLEIAAEAPVTRPHIARALVEAGHAATLQQAFDHYLANDAAAYVPRPRMTPEEGILLIHRAGGTAVLAHPGRVKQWEPLLHRLSHMGLDGVETHHPMNAAEVTHRASEIAQSLGLIATGGSDFHRPQPDGLLLLGTVAPPPFAVERLWERAQTYASFGSDGR